MLKNQRGMGLIAVLIASGMVVLLALAVGRFITQFNQQSIRTENSVGCQNIAKEVLEYFKKDDNALFITSVGPDPITKKFPSGIMNEDGVERFNFYNNTVFSGTSPITIASTEQPLPASATFYNYLNYRNSFNRLFALAFSKNRCCTDAATCSGLLYDSQVTTNNPPGLKLSNNGNPFKVYLGVNPTEAGSSLCSGNTPSRLVDPKATDIRLEFYVRVVTNPDDAQKASQCVGSGQVQFPRDTNAPLTILSLDTSTFCGAGKTKPSMCLPSGASPTATDIVRYKVRTVRNTQACRNCLAGLSPYRCNPSNGDAFSSCYSAATCTGSDPGSVFLCRIGEKKWFYNSANFNKWEPCESAHVYDGAGVAIAGATVTIDYNTAGTAASYTGSATADATKQQTYTEATISLSGLTPQAAYVVDVRAADGGGQKVSDSFCNYSGNCYLGIANPADGVSHFVISNNPPQINSVGPVDTSIVGPATSNRQGSVQPSGRYRNAMNGFSGQFQCSTQYKPFFDVSYSYNNNPNSLILGIENGMYTLSPATPAVSRPLICDDGGNCSFQTGPKVTDLSGVYTVTASMGNECFPAGAPRAFSWCLDKAPAFSATAAGGNYDSTLTSPGAGITGQTSVSGKVCGIAFARPFVVDDGTSNFSFTTTSSGTPAKDAFLPSAMGWVKATHSGCVARDTATNPGVQYCVRAFDPCGRAIDSNVATYSATLAENSPATNHRCGGGSGSYGNQCDSGLFCSSTNKCLDRNLPYASLPGNQCDNDTDCNDATDCIYPLPNGTHGSCSTTYYCDAGNPLIRDFSCQNQNQACIVDKGPCRRVCSNDALRICTSDANCPLGGTCNPTVSKCQDDTSISCTSGGSECQINGQCKYQGSQGVCSRPSNLTCGNTTNFNANHACPDLNSCTISSPPPPSCPTPTCPPPVGGYPVGCPSMACPNCQWAPTNAGTCVPPDPCDCAYAPSFTTNASVPLTFACRDTVTGNACDPSLCTDPMPTDTETCSQSCNQTMNCGGVSTPPTDPPTDPFGGVCRCIAGRSCGILGHGYSICDVDIDGYCRCRQMCSQFPIQCP